MRGLWRGLVSFWRIEYDADYCRAFSTTDGRGVAILLSCGLEYVSNVFNVRMISLSGVMITSILVVSVSSSPINCRRVVVLMQLVSPYIVKDGVIDLFTAVRKSLVMRHDDGTSCF